ncbi:FAD-dependent oxidoreductase [Falsiroseomonas sp. CW058]|uniref:FAD-dependent oxidoreductase n=1 Tax=Falsiroseomonas sp. CW058 TaxID=3388664 RepID=UPI003D31BCD5
MTQPPFDPFSTLGRRLHVEERADLLVVGAGAAGLAAALEGRRQGRGVMLVDENPIPPATMGDDIPLMFGGCMAGAVRNRNAMLEAVLAGNPRLVEAVDAGVDLRLGTVCWGIHGNAADVGWLPGLLAGLAEDGRSWIVQARQVVVAAGRRDMGLAFAGWDLPGVTGMAAALRLATAYGALDARRALVLGTSAEALSGALALREAGVEVAGLVEAGAEPVGPAALLAEVAAAGIPLFRGMVPRRAEGRGRVEEVVLVPAGPPAGPRAETRIACDTVVLAIGAVPVIELLGAAGCRLRHDGARGGHVPVLDALMRSSVPGLSAAGDCAGTWEAKSLSPAIAEEEGRRAASAAAAGDPAAGLRDADPGGGLRDEGAYRLGWVRAALLAAEGEPHVCRCEEVTAREILEVRPPRYLAPGSRRQNARDLASLLGEGPPHPDQVKRLTRAGMGVCQGRRCREQVAALMALQSGCDPGEVPLATYRAPVRPLPLSTLADRQEDPAMARHWDTWFGMPLQFAPVWKQPARYVAAASGPARPASE